MTAKRSVTYSIYFLVGGLALIALSIDFWPGEGWLDKTIYVLGIVVGVFALFASVATFVTRHYGNSE